MNNNLERYYVIDQRGFVSMAFELDTWEEARRYADVVFPREVLDYVNTLTAFNKLFQQCRDFEETYSSSVENKTRENAIILHDLKERLDLDFHKIKTVILSAQKALRPLLERRA